jgi:hypothetical protein
VNTALRAILWALSIGVWIFSAGFDGAFLQTLMPAGWLGAVAAYGLNFVADVSNELLAYAFMKLQQYNRRGSKKYKWSYVLLFFEAFALYFGTVFSYATVVSAAPDLPGWLQWSAALFAQVTLLGLGVAQALLDVRVKSESPGASSDASTAQAPKASDALPSYVCTECGKGFASSGAYANHVRWQHRNGNGVKEHAHALEEG